jgi:hypothetical protein
MKLQDYCLKVEKFIPLTYLEVQQKKPLIIKLNDKWNFVTYPQSALNFALLINRKDYVHQVFESVLNHDVKTNEEQAERTKTILLGVRKLISILYEISKQEHINKEKEYREFLDSYFLHDTDALIEVFTKVLNLNTRLEKKNAVPDDLRGVSTPGPVDRWSGVFVGRRDLKSKTFIEFIIEQEENTRASLREYKNAKNREKKSKRGAKGNPRR